MPDARTLHGLAEVENMLTGWVESFAEFSATPGDVIDAGEHVVVPISFAARPHGADSPVTIEETQVYTVQHGAIVRVREYRTKAEALERLLGKAGYFAVGLVATRAQQKSPGSSGPFAREAR